MNPWRALRSLPRAMWVLFAATLINRAGWMVLPFLTLYLTRSLGCTAGEAGVVLAVYGVVALATSPLAGTLSDRYGAPRIMCASLFLSAAVLLGFPLARSYEAVLLATALLAFANELFRPANLSVISEIASEEQRRSAFAVIRLASSLGMSVGPAAGGLLAATSFSRLFLVNAVTTLATALVLLFAFRPASGAQSRSPVAAKAGAEAVTEAEAEAVTEAVTGAEAVTEAVTGARSSKKKPVRPRVTALGDTRLVFFLAAALLIMLVFFQHFSTLSLYMVKDLGLSMRTYGLMFTVNTLLIATLEVPLCAATARWPHRRSLSLGAFLCGAGFGATGLATSAPSLLATVVVWTFAEMILIPSMSAYVADIAPPDRRGAYMGLYSMTFNLSFSVGPWLGGMVLARWGGGALWASCFVVCALAAAMMARLKEPPLLAD